MGIADDLSHKLGPAPVWVWSVGFAGLYLLYSKSHAKTAASAASAASVASTASGGSVPASGSQVGTYGAIDPSTGQPYIDPTTGQPYVTQFDPNAIDPTTGLTYAQEGDPTQQPFPTGPIDALLASDPTNPAYPVGGTPQGIPGPVTNSQWQRLVSDYLISLGSVPTEVNTALTDYLAGKALTAQETAIVNEAERYLGAPPVPVPTPTGKPPWSIGGVAGTVAMLRKVANPKGGGAYGPATQYRTDTETATDGHVYKFLPSGPAVAKAIATGKTIYYQPDPGVMVVIPKSATGGIGQPWSAVPTYVRVG